LLRCSRLDMLGFLRKRIQSIQRYEFLQVGLAGHLLITRNPGTDTQSLLVAII
jgi:hypothetical protein